MTCSRLLAALAVGLTFAGASARAEPAATVRGYFHFPYPNFVKDGPCPPMCCPDDYRAKKLPCAPPCTSCCLPDDYCAKELPCAPPCVRCSGPDDYCRKSCPIRIGIGHGPWYTCGMAPTCAPLRPKP